MKRDPILEALVTTICNDHYVTAMESDAKEYEDSPDKEKSIMERPRWMSKVRIKRDPMIESLAKQFTPTRRSTKRNRKNTTLKKTKLRMSHLNSTSTPSHPTKKSRLCTSHRKTKSRANKTIDRNADGSIIVNNSITKPENDLISECSKIFKFRYTNQGFYPTIVLLFMFTYFTNKINFISKAKSKVMAMI